MDNKFTFKLSPKAETFIEKEISKNNNLKYFRIGVKGGGCVGYTYSFEFDSIKKDTDLSFESDGFTLIVDPKSAVLLDGSTIDYHNSLIKAGFKVTNPNAKHSCGCGKSFSK